MRKSDPLIPVVAAVVILIASIGITHLLLSQMLSPDSDPEPIPAASILD